MRFIAPLLDALDAQVAVVETLGPDSLSAPSMCAGWNVRDVLSHSVGVTLKLVDFATGRTDTPHAREVTIDDVDPTGAVVDARDAARAAWPVADPNRTCRMPFGAFSTEHAAGINLVDALGHTWDIAAALRRPIPCDETVWADALLAAAAVVPAGGNPHYAAALPVVDGASPMARFLARIGRSPTT